MNQTPERKLAAIMFTDIAGYTALSAKDETSALKLLDTQKQILTPIIKEFNGTLHKEIGDGLLFTFPTVTDAVKCGIKIQGETKADDDLNLRIGIHEGEITLKDGDALGDDVNVASRIETFSPSGGIAISSKVQQNISSLPEFETSYVGKPELKGVAQEVKVYCITSHGLTKADEIDVPVVIESRSNFNIFALTGGILTAIGIAFWIAIGIFGISFAEKPLPPSVGILMMDNLGSQEDEFWAKGITGDLIIKIASSGNIRVSSMKEIASIDINESFEKIAERLNVKYILTSEIYRKDNEFDLRSQLINTDTGISEYANKWTEKNENAANIINSLADQLLEKIAPNLENTTEDKMINSESYAYYLKGKSYGGEFMNYKNLSSEELILSRELLSKAIELDSTNIDAQIQLARTYIMYIEDVDNTVQLLNNSIRLCRMYDKEKDLGRVYRNIGLAEFREWAGGKANFSNMPSYDNFKKAASIAKIYNDSWGYKTAIGNIMSSFTNERDSETSKDSVHYYANLLLTYAAENNNLVVEEFTQRKLGSFYLYSDNHRNKKKAQYYYNKSYELIENQSIETQINIYGALNKSLDNVYEKINNENKRINLSENIQSTWDLVWSFINLAQLYSYPVTNFDEAYNAYNKASSYKSMLHDFRSEEIRINIGWGDIYLFKGDYNNALTFYKSAESIGLLSDWYNYERYAKIARVYHYLEDFTNAKIYFSKTMDYIKYSSVIPDDISSYTLYLLNELKLGLISSSIEEFNNPFDQIIKDKEKITINQLAHYLLSIDLNELEGLVIDQELFLIYYNLYEIYTLENNSIISNQLIDRAYNEILDQASKLHKNDRERFFNDNKLVSKVISEWKKVNSSAIN